MRKITLAFCLLLCWHHVAYADFYVGFNAGHSRLDTPDYHVFNPMGSHIRDSKEIGGYGGGASIGYISNSLIPMIPNWGIDLSYLYFASSLYTARQGLSIATLQYKDSLLIPSLQIGVNLSDYISTGINFGMSHVNQTLSYSNPINIALRLASAPPAGDSTQTTWLPNIGLHVDGGIDSFSIGGFANYTYSKEDISRNPTAIPSMVMLGVRLAYHFF